MKSTFLIFIAILFSLTAIAQQNYCKSLHNGFFKISTPETGTTTITRNANTQTEVNDLMGFTVVFYVNWTDDCTYELRIKKVLKGASGHDWKKGDVITCNILSVRDNSYLVRTSSNFFDNVMEFEMQIVK